MSKTTKQPVAGNVFDVPLSDIKPDPNQPRKTFDEAALLELADSVEQHDIIQPIGLRAKANGGPFTIIYGERRFRAAKIVEERNPDRKTIRAIIINATNENDIKEIQLTENLFRENINPMEEALAFMALHEKRTPEEIAATIGKSVNYVKTRLKIAKLIPAYQAVFAKKELEVEVALQLSQLPEKTQKEIWKNEGERVRMWDLSKYLSLFSHATWGMDEEFKGLPQGLNKCNGCQFNTATSVLFSEGIDNAKCMNPKCFQIKSEKSFERRLVEAKKNPDVVFIANGYISKEELEKLQKEHGIDKIYTDDKFRAVKLDARPTIEDTDEDLPIKDRQKKLADLVKEWDEEKKQYDKAIASGKYKKAFSVSGYTAGEEIYVSTEKTDNKPGTKAADIKAKIADDKLTKEDVKEEEKRIKEREQRYQQIDQNKIHAATVEAAEKNKPAIMELPAQTIDRGILLAVLFDLAGFQEKEHVRKLKFWPKDNHGFGYHEDYFKQLSKLSEKQVAQVARTIVFVKYGGEQRGDVSRNDTMLKLIAVYGKVDVKAIEKEFLDAANERRERQKEKIASLKKKL